MKVAFFEIEYWQKGYLAEKLPKNMDVVFLSEKLSMDNIEKAKRFEIVSIFIDSVVSPAIISALPNLKMIATRSTGFDHISMDACKARNVTVCNVPSYGENTVA